MLILFMVAACYPSIIVCFLACRVCAEYVGSGLARAIPFLLGLCLALGGSLVRIDDDDVVQPRRQQYCILY